MHCMKRVQNQTNEGYPGRGPSPKEGEKDPRHRARKKRNHLPALGGGKGASLGGDGLRGVVKKVMARRKLRR